jgi:WD40 repeat protein
VLASGSADATARLWRVEKRRCPTPLAEVKHPDAVSGVNFHPSGEYMCTACADFNVRVLIVRSAAAAPAVLRAHSGPVWSSALWDWRRAARVGTLHGHANWVLDARFNSQGSTIASASKDRSVRIWDVNTCDQVLELWGHESFATCCAFGGGCSSVASQVFSGGHDKVVRQWDQNSGMEVAQVLGLKPKL